MKKHSPRVWLRAFARSIILVANLLVAICLLLSYASLYISPEKVWIIAFFGLGYPVFMVLNLCFLLYWGFKLKLKLLISALSILIGFSIHAHVFNIPILKTKVPTINHKIKILTYNVHGFRSFDFEKDSSVRKQIFNIIHDENPDVVCFQEYYSKKQAKGTSNLLKTQYHLPYFYIEPTLENKTEVMGMAIFSRFPINNKRALNLEDGVTYNNAIKADITIGTDTFTFINAHLHSISFKKDDYDYLKDVKERFDPNIDASRKIGSRLKSAFIIRAKQAEKIANEVKNSKRPVFICGDFNDTPVSYAFKTASAGLKHTFFECGTGFPVTYAGKFPNLQIDYIFCPQSVYPLTYKVVHQKLSDHYPVISTIGW